MMRVKSVLLAREALIFIIVLVVGAIVSLLSPYFLTEANMKALFLGLSIEAILAIGTTILLVSGGFDLSIGSVVGLCGMLSGLLILQGIPLPIVLIVTLIAGIVIGLINGTIIAKLGVNPFVTTLAMLSISRGLVYVITQGKPAIGLPASFTVIGQGNFLGIQYPIWYMLILVVLGDLVLRKVRFFRQNYYIGGNEKSAALSGINVSRVKMFNYALMALLAAIAGIILTARVGTASVSAGTGLELKVISAVVIGGASLNGGEGSVLGALLGTLLMAIISNALNLLGISVYWQQLITGLVLVIAVIIDTWGNKRQKL